MRVLVGHTNQMPELNEHRPLPGREAQNDAILAFGNGYAQVAVDPSMSWNAMLAACPPGWQPDVYIHWSPEYNVIPEGLEEANCLTVGVYGDWNLGGQAMQSVSDLFDVLYADRNGGALLRQAGFENVHYAPLWAFDPALHRRLPPAETPERDLDIVMVGNFNHHVQQERARWLARVARLSDRYRVLLTSGVYGEEYTRLLNRARIVFNRSIRGEINMRAYEAPACGALLFYEAENPEIGELFADGVECVLYTAENLEDRLAYYLASENRAEREAIAAAGWRKVQSHTYAHHFAQMLDQLQPLVTERQTSPDSASARRFRHLDPRTQTLRRVTQWMLSPARSVYPLAEQRLEATLQASPESTDPTQAQLCNLYAVLEGDWASCLPASTERNRRFRTAIASAERALDIDPLYLAARANLGFLLIEANRPDAGEAVLQQVWAQSQTESFAADALRGGAFPRRFDFFSVALERCWAETRPGSERWREQMTALLRGRIGMALGERAYARNAFADACAYAEVCAALLPALADAHLLAARSLRALGRLKAADTAYAQALAQMPFLFAAWEELARLRLDAQMPDRALTLLADWETLIGGCPLYADWIPAINKLRAETRALIQQQEMASPVTRLLAFPDWRQTGQWQALVAAFTRAYTASDPTLLMLRADPENDPDAMALLRQLETYLVGDLRLNPSALPNITLVNQPLAPADRWKLIHAAHTVLDSASLPADWRALAETMRVPLRTLEDLTLVQAA